MIAPQVEPSFDIQKDRLAPKVSVGLPVRNGERYLAAAIESILAQSYENFELIISDNASTDRTEEVCRKYATLDQRVKYDRADRNRGAAANFNRVVELASGEYFKWAAHDDMLSPDYLEKCVTALNADPNAVLCYTWVKEIDERGDLLFVGRSRLIGADVESVPARFSVLISQIGNCREVFGLIRTAAVRRTSLHQSYEGEDRALLAELAMLGRFIELPEPLFLHREHSDRFAHRTRQRGRGYFGLDINKSLTWYDPDKAHQTMLYTWRRALAYYSMVRRHVPHRRQRMLCYGHLLRWMGSRRNLVILLLEPIVVPNPWLYRAVRKLRWRLAPSVHGVRSRPKRHVRSTSEAN